MPPLGDAPPTHQHILSFRPHSQPDEPNRACEGRDAATAAGTRGLRHPVPHLGVYLRQGVVHAFAAYPEGNDIARNGNRDD